MSSYERAIVISNPASSRAESVQRKVITPLEQANIPFMSWRTKSPNSQDNIADIAELLRDGDRLVIASGDGVANQAANAMLDSRRTDVTIGALPFGGFNDMAATFGGEGTIDPTRMLAHDAATTEAFPLAISANGEHLRFATLYSTLGWTGLAAAVMDSPELRTKIQSSKLKQPRMILEATKLYIDKRNDSALPDFTNSGERRSGITDIAFINGPTMARTISTGKPYYEGSTFSMTELDVSSILANLRFLGTGALNTILRSSMELPGAEVTRADIRFSQPASFAIQADGEVTRLTDVRNLDVIKHETPLHVVSLKKSA